MKIYKKDSDNEKVITCIFHGESIYDSNDEYFITGFFNITNI